jgi:putative ABC transport system substrate-binding protein
MKPPAGVWRSLGMVLLLYGSTVFGQAAAVAVLYPDVREPYRAVFTNLVEGIRARVGARLRTYPISDPPDLADLQRWLDSRPPAAIIALGRSGLRAVSDLHAHVPVVAGALLLLPGTDEPVNAGVSLAADPEEIFSRLKWLAPQVKRVFVVYNPDQNTWLIGLAKRAATRHGIELVSYAADDLHTAVLRYREIMERASNSSDSVWLPLDSTTVDDRVILPLVLEAAWDKRFVVFSSNPAHAQRGALFSVYPDNLALGERLAEIAVRLEKGGDDSSGIITPLKDLKIAVNLRTADHLGLQFSPGQQRQFGLVFPSP